MRAFFCCVLAILATLCQYTPALAGGGKGIPAGGGNGITGVSWQFTGTSWELYANATVDTVALNADLGDQNINLPPGGVNTGLFSSNGSILGSSTLSLGVEVVSFPRALTITPSGTGSVLDAAWYAQFGSAAVFDPVEGYRVFLGEFFIDPGATLGGAFGGPGANTQSRIYIGWIDDLGIDIAVFDIPEACVALVNVPTDVATIQAAIDAVCDGGEIIVGPGTYNQAFNTNGKAVWIHSSAGAATTILDGTALGVPVVTIDSGEGLTTIIEGFTITNGSAANGGGMFISASSPTVTSCIFASNTATNDGGGVYNSGGSPAFDLCDFNNNTATLGRGGAVACDGGAATFSNSNFNGNNALGVSGDGGGLVVISGSVTVTTCLFDLNNAALVGGGIGVIGGSLTMTGSTITNNAATTGGGVGITGTGTAAIGTTSFCDNFPSHIGGAYTDNTGNTFCPLCIGDINGDGDVGMADLLELLACFGGAAGCNPFADLNNDGFINSIDLTFLLGSWGLCP